MTAPTANRQSTAILLLAAGGSSRMKGRDKLLERIDGVPLLRRAALACQNSGAGQIVVVLRPQDIDRWTCLDETRCISVENAQWAEGMASSIRAGLKALAPDTAALIIALADMPDIGPQDYDALIDGFDPALGVTICRAANETGVPGNPVLFGNIHFKALSRLTGDRGAKEVLRDHSDQVRLVDLPANRALTDLDTVQDWDAYRKT